MKKRFRIRIKLFLFKKYCYSQNLYKYPKCKLFFAFYSTTRTILNINNNLIYQMRLFKLEFELFKMMRRSVVINSNRNGKNSIIREPLLIVRWSLSFSNCEQKGRKSLFSRLASISSEFLRGEKYIFRLGWRRNEWLN